MLKLKRVATRPGWKQLAVTPVPSRRARQLGREQDVGELRLTVAPQAPVGTFGVEIVERNARALVSGRRRGDDAGRCARLEPVEQQRSQQERGEVVDGPCHFDAVDGELAAGEDRAGIVGEDVDARIALQNLPRHTADLRLAGEVGQEDIDRRAAAGRPRSISATAARARPSSRAIIASASPRAAKAFAAARPMPLVAPVITTCILGISPWPPAASGLPSDGRRRARACRAGGAARGWCGCAGPCR